MTTGGERGPAIGPPTVFLLVLILGLALQPSDIRVGALVEDGLNVVLAQAIAAGDGLRLAHLPEAPSAGWFPPLYPLLLSLVWTVWPVFPDNLALIHVLDSLLLAGAAGFSLATARRFDVPPWLVWGVTAVAFAGFPVLWLAHLRLGAATFLLTAAVAVWLADRRVLTAPAAAVAGIFAALAAAAAIPGSLVPISVAGAIAWKHGRRRAATCAVGSLLVLTIWWVAVPSGAADVAPGRGTVSVDALMGLVGPGRVGVLAAGGEDVLAGITGVVATVVIGWGAVSSIAAAPAFVATSAAAVTVTSLAVWELDGAGRIGWEASLVPWLLILFATGCFRLWGARAATRIPVFLVAVSMGLGVVRSATAAAPLTRVARDRSAPWDWMVGSLMYELPPDAVVLTELDALVRLYGNRPTAYFDGSTDPDAWTRYCRWGITHLATPESRWPSRVWPGPDRPVRPVFEIAGGGGVYRVICSDAGATP